MVLQASPYSMEMHSAGQDEGRADMYDMRELCAKEERRSINYVDEFCVLCSCDSLSLSRVFHLILDRSYRSLYLWS